MKRKLKMASLKNTGGTRTRRWSALWLAVLFPLLAFAGGEEVVVIYNPQMPGSKIVAEHYAAMRHVPANQVFSFKLTTN